VRESVRDARAGLERRVTATLTPAELDHLRSAPTIARMSRAHPFTRPVPPAPVGVAGPAATLHDPAG
jgi:hypothetical protein